MENTVNTAPVGQLKTNKGLLKTILLSIVTLGIYSLVVMSAVSNDINIVASRYDGKKTMHYCLLTFIVAPITLGIAGIVWSHRISNRIGAELNRRGIAYSFSATDFSFGVANVNVNDQKLCFMFVRQQTNTRFWPKMFTKY